MDCEVAKVASAAVIVAVLKKEKRKEKTKSGRNRAIWVKASKTFNTWSNFNTNERV